MVEPGEAKENGSGVEPDCGAAAGWYGKVPDPGNAEAMLGPGFFEGNRFGAVHDGRAAGIRLDKAAQRGNAEAMKKTCLSVCRWARRQRGSSQGCRMVQIRCRKGAPEAIIILASCRNRVVNSRK